MFKCNLVGEEKFHFSMEGCEHSYRNQRFLSFAEFLRPSGDWASYILPKTGVDRDALLF